MMTLSYNFGLTAGSLLAYVIESMLNPLDTHPCGPSPFDVKLHTYSANTTTTTATTLATYTTINSFTTVLLSTIASTVTDASNNTSLLNR